MNSRAILRSLAGILLGAFIFGLLCSLGLNVPANVQLPLGDLTSVVVDQSGHIYCDSAFYSRIQVYSNTGDFLTGWFVPGKHRYKLHVNDQQHLVVTTTNGQFEFDATGAKLSEDTAHKPNDIDRAGSITPDKDGNIYSIENRYFFPHVEVHTESGATRSIVNGPVYLWPLSGPVPCWLCAMTLLAMSQGMKAAGRGKLMANG